MRVHALGEAAVVVVLGESVDSQLAARALAVATEFERARPAGVVDIVPAFASVAVVFDPARAAPFASLVAELERRAERAIATMPAIPSRRVELPVCYGGEHGPDLAAVAAHVGLPVEAVVRRHAEPEYLVHAIGFAPGFPYLGGLPEGLTVPRRATPRSRVPAGSVGIGGAQTGVYPFSTPGGWNLIGRTPRRLFVPDRREPSLLHAGDRVAFHPVSAAEFSGLAADDAQTERGVLPVVGPVVIRVRRAGMFTTIQDAGRRGQRALGVPLSGAADPFALRLVNALVGNPDEAAALEFTLRGPELTFERAAVVAVGGAEFAGLPSWRPFEVAAGATLDLGTARAGCRGYLAVAGGFDVPVVLGSRSTYGRAGIGGHEGRALRDGDALSVPAVERRVRDRWRVDPRILPAYSASPVVRVIDGLHAAEFDAAWLGRTFRVGAHSDRMGMRLQGEPVGPGPARELASLPVVPGTIQVPPDGQPIVLLADAQTIGGYPQIAYVAGVDLPLLAQLRPGDTVRFQRIELAEARERACGLEKAFGLLREGLAQKLA